VDRGLKIHRSTRTSTVDRGADEVWSVMAGGGPGSHWYVDALPFVVRGGIDRALGGAGGRCTVSRSVSFEPDGLLGQLHLVADLPFREVVVGLAHRRLLADLDAA